MENQFKVGDVVVMKTARQLQLAVVNIIDEKIQVAYISSPPVKIEVSAPITFLVFEKVS